MANKRHDNKSKAPEKTANTIGKKEKRKLGILEGKGKIAFGKDFKMTEAEFIGI